MPSNTPSKRPNIIWFMCDQMRGQATGVNGDPNVFTPNLDNMASCGVNFPNAVSGYPLCCPCRGSMLTGKYAHNHSVRVHEDRLDPSFKTVTDVYNAHGYETIYLGKWHLAGFKERDGRAALRIVPKEDRGRFATWIGYENNNAQYDCHLHGHDGGEEIDLFKLPGYETDCLTDMAIERLEQRSASDRPFFMVISVQPPHMPAVAPPEFRHYQAQQLELRPNVPVMSEVEARVMLSGYYAQIENVDYNVGRVLETLRETGLIDDTHLMFFSDHGDQMGSQGRFGKCVPFEESIRVPFLIGGGVPIQGALTNNAPPMVNHVDIAPTSLGLCGIETPDWMEGFDYSHWRTRHNFEQRVEEEPQSVYLQLIGWRESGYAWRSIITKDGWKYACVENGEWLLFNLELDPYEQTNLALHTNYRAKREEMKALLRDWIQKTGDDFPVPK